MVTQKDNSARRVKVGETWRPKGWDNEGILIATPNEAYELGADAMLKAIKAEFALHLFSIDLHEMPVIVRDGQQVLIGIQQEGELPFFLSAFTARGDYVLSNCLITGKPAPPPSEAVKP